MELNKGDCPFIGMLSCSERCVFWNNNKRCCAIRLSNDTNIEKYEKALKEAKLKDDMKATQPLEAEFEFWDDEKHQYETIKWEYDGVIGSY